MGPIKTVNTTASGMSGNITDSCRVLGVMVSASAASSLNEVHLQDNPAGGTFFKLNMGHDALGPVVYMLPEDCYFRVDGNVRTITYGNVDSVTVFYQGLNVT